MKILYLVRHAKSSWDDPNLTDFERPLNARGRRDAPIMARYLRDKNIVPQHLVSSPATRAITTARIFADKLSIARKSIQIEAKLYNATRAQLLGTISKIDDCYESTMVFGHDTSMTVVAEELSNQRMLHYPTCAVCCIVFDVDTWQQAAQSTGRLQFFYFPKGIAAEQKAEKAVDTLDNQEKVKI